MLNKNMGKHKPETRKRLNSEYRERNRDKLRASNIKSRSALRHEILNIYGLSCAICGFLADKRVLQIDHIHNNGAEERRALGGRSHAGNSFYIWLKRQGFPSGYQTLCANCNLIKYFDSKLVPEDAG